MELTLPAAESMVEKLHDFNPNMNVRIKDKTVVATIQKLEVDGEQLKALGEIVEDRKVSLDRTGDKLRIVIN